MTLSQRLVIALVGAGLVVAVARRLGEPDRKSSPGTWRELTGPDLR
jgi:hypothetical protein